MKRITLCVTLVLLVLAVCCHINPGSVNAQETPAAIVERLLNQSGYNVVKKSSNVWYIDFRGKNSPPFKVIVTTAQNLIVVFVTVIEKRNFTASVGALQRLLKFNHELDRVKVALDRDDDVSVRIDGTPRVTDLQELKEIIEQVAAATDAVYVGMKPFLATGG